MNRRWAYYETRDGELVAKSQGSGAGGWIFLQKRADNSLEAVSEEPVLLFVSEHADVPALKPGEERWIEVTVPKKGPPRPIRLGLKKDGKLAPVALE